MIEFFNEIHALIFDETRLPVAIAAILAVILIGLITGPLGNKAYPFFWAVMNGLFGNFGAKMDKAGRPRGDLLFRGFILTATALGVAYFIGKLAVLIGWYFPDFKVMEGLLLLPLLSGGALWKALIILKKALESETNIKGAFRTIALTSRSDLLQNDDFTITRIGIALSVRSFDKGLVAPIFWYLVGGLPAAYLYVALTAIAWRFGRDGHTSGFGAPALALEKLMGFIPHYLSAFLVAVAAVFTPTAQMSRALIGLLKPAPYEEGGAVMGAASYALSATLGGASKDLDGIAIKRAWIGPQGATAQLESKHLHRALYLTVFAHLLFITALFGAIVISGNNLLTF